MTWPAILVLAGGAYGLKVAGCHAARIRDNREGGFSRSPP